MALDFRSASRAAGTAIERWLATKERPNRLMIPGLPIHTGQTISLIMRKLLIAISNSATISSEGLIVQLLGVLIADVLIMDPHNAHLAISRFMPHASRRAPA